MADREKLVEILANYFRIGDSYHFVLGRTKEAFGMGTMGLEDFREYDEDDVAEIAEHLIANGVTIQKWIPVTERLPELNPDGTVNAVLVTDGCVQHMAYFVNGEWLFAESGEMKEPMYYMVTHWMPLPEPPQEEDE